MGKGKEMREDFAILDRFVLDKMRENKVPGMSISIVADGRVPYQKGFGFRDILSGLPATPRTLYGIGSVTKSFTALAIMQLVEEGRISLDDSVDKYVPAVPKPFGEAPRIRHLLSHTSGLPALGYDEALSGGVTGADDGWLPVCSPEDVIVFMQDAGEWAVCRPGERHFYLNEGYVLLGYIISKLSGTSYEEYVQERILRPLRMERTFFAKADVDKESDRATPYVIDRGGRHIASNFHYGINADGGLVSNVIDLTRYIEMCIGRGEYEGKRLVGKKTFEALEEPRINLPYEYFGKESYGFGWRITPDFYGNKLIGHSGGVVGHTAYVGYVPDRKVGVVILANPSNYPLSQIGMCAIARLIDIDPNTLPFVKKENILNKLQGQYETYKGTIKVNVRKKGDFLVAEFKDRYTEEMVTLIPEKLEEEKATFYTISDGARVPAEFQIGKDRTEWIYERYKAVKK
jgi:CubicO group peptidase (beta-lactamase class C family)